ncbi:hypothetical protein, partial [Methylobacterium soli]
ASPAAQAQPVARTVLALYDGGIEASPVETRIHRYAEFPLNHLGYTLEYRDIRALPPRPVLPTEVELARYAGVLTWYSTPPATRKTYLDWARTTLRAARRLIVLGSPGGAFWTDEVVAVDAILGRIGLRHGHRAVALTLGAVAQARMRSATHFEGPPDPVLPPFEVVEAVRPDVEPWLAIGLPPREGGGRSLTVAVSDRGGYAATGYEIAEDPASGRARWLVDPFAFFARALRTQPWPVPDVTTLSGRRIFFSHVESEGLNHVVLTKTREPMLVAQLFRDAVVARYPDLPATFALTPGDLDPALGGNETPREVVRTIWSYPQVEPSIASYTRPYRWGFFADYDRTREEELVADARAPGRFSLRWLTDYISPDSRASRYVAKSREYPRNYLLRPFDLTEETRTALSAATQLAPESKPIRLYQWTGDANPSEEQIAATRRIGLLNMNGGESRLDHRYPSITHLLPLARPVGSQRQIYAAGADEIPLARAWRPAVEALRAAATTAANTGAPRRLKGQNLHYHLASIGNPQALHLIQKSLEAARAAPVIPIRASDYAAMADDFFDLTVTALAPDLWSVAHRGAVQTLRLDEAEGVQIDLARSRGVLGQSRHAGSLYIALDDAVEVAEVALSREMTSGPAISLHDSRWRVRRLERNATAWRFEAEGYGEGAFAWDGVAPGRYRIAAERAGALLWTAEAQPDASGRLAFTVPVTGIEPLHLTIARRLESAEGTP